MIKMTKDNQANKTSISYSLSLGILLLLFSPILWGMAVKSDTLFDHYFYRSLAIITLGVSAMSMIAIFYKPLRLKLIDLLEKRPKTFPQGLCQGLYWAIFVTAFVTSWLLGYSKIAGPGLFPTILFYVGFIWLFVMLYARIKIKRQKTN